MLKRLLILACILAGTVSLNFAQCTPPVLDTSAKGNMLSPELEYELGEINGAQDEISYHLLEVDELKQHLREIGQRIEAHLPANSIKFRYFIVDDVPANAWALPGGRIYVTRKLISFARREDELAAVIAHEMGHQLVHHGSLRWSKILRDSLNVTSIRNREELEDAMNRLMDTYKRKGVFPNDEEKDQMQADQVAVYALASAGYDTKAASEFWDRFTGLQGKKGNWLMDVFGGTTSDAKRLRAFVNVANGLSPTCINKALPVDAAAFSKWQEVIRTYNGPGQTESLHHVALKRQLYPPLRSEITHLKFSPDGKYILAQDETSIFVMTRDPLTTVARIEADNAYPAKFSSDSNRIVFYNETLRTQRWNVDTKELEDVGEVHALRGCLQSALSADGKYLACVTFPEANIPFPLQLKIFDTATNQEVFVKKAFLGKEDQSNWLRLRYFLLLRIATHQPIVTMEFSPDSEYLLAGGGNNPLAVKLSTKQEVSLPGSVTRLLPLSFAFLGNDRLVGVSGFAVGDIKGDKSAIVRFPSGEVLASDLPIGPLALSSPGHGDFVIARPLPRSPAGIMDLQKREFTIGTKTDAIDIYDDVYVAERVSGEIALYRYPTPTPIATTRLDDAPISRVHTFTMSSDQKYLAVSERKRGAVWDLSSGMRVQYLRGFRAAEFDGNSMIFDFPPMEDYVPPHMRHASVRDERHELGEDPGHSIVLMGADGSQLVERDKFLRKTRVTLNGPYLLVMNADKFEEEWNKNVDLEVRDARTGTRLWARRFDRRTPSLNCMPGSDKLILTWDLSESAVRDEIKGDKDAKQKLDAIHAAFEGSYFLEAIDLKTGKSLVKFPIDAGDSSFKLVKAYAFGDKIFTEDSFHRVSVYSFDGSLVRRYFGILDAISPDGNYIVMGTGRGRLSLVKVGIKESQDNLTFESRVSHVEFTQDGKRIYVLTRDQMLYAFNLDPLLSK
jgi:WD40 repeat protein